MASLTQPRMRLETTLKSISLPLAAGATAWANGIACADTGANVVKPGAAGNANLRKIGEFEESVNNSAGTGTVMVLVNLDHELVGRWYDNATGANAATLSNLFAPVYIQDDHTVTTSASGNSEAGRVWGVDAIKGVLVVSDPETL